MCEGAHNFRRVSKRPSVSNLFCIHSPTASASWYWASFSGIKWPGHGVGHPPPSRAELNLLVPELFFYLILAHPVYKM